jgi:aspartyl-tRNA(Asn)/glutamyl-tRNA(Gln) amidotransferase subunit A
MRISELRELTLVKAVSAVKSRRLSPVELSERLLERAKQTESEIRAYLTFNEDLLAQAQASEEKIRQKKKLRVLEGIPITVKDLIRTKGIRTTAGSKLLSDNIPDYDATVVRKIKGSGGLVFGKSNTHEFALGGVTPPTKNPWDRNFIPGGSSGGSAAAIAASSALASLGSDTGGSIRIPACYCGVVGLKPTYGRVSRFGVYPESWSLDHVGPITKTVEDAALMMNVISGFDRMDPNSVRAPVPNFTAPLRKSIKGLKIGIPENHFYTHVQDDVLRTVKEAIRQLERLGAHLDYFEFPSLKAIMAAYDAIDTAEVSSFHEDLYRERKSEYQPDVKSYIELGFTVTAVQYLKAQRLRAFLTSKLRELYSKFQVIVTPTQPMPAPALKASMITYPDGFEENELNAMVRFLAPFNLTGLPAISVRCGFASSRPKLPIGLQIIGDLFDEATVLRVAYAYERSTNWNEELPPPW